MRGVFGLLLVGGGILLFWMTLTGGVHLPGSGGKPPEPGPPKPPGPGPEPNPKPPPGGKPPEPKSNTPGSTTGGKQV